MKAICLMILYAILCTTSGWAQDLKPTVISSDGGTSSGGGISLEWTLGESSVETISSGSHMYTQGFHQPMLMVRGITPAGEKLFAGYTILVAPNPVQSMLQVTVDVPGEEGLRLSITDLSGRHLYARSTNGKGSIHVDMSGYIAGIYVLSVRALSGQLIRSFKIIKVQ